MYSAQDQGYTILRMYPLKYRGRHFVRYVIDDKSPLSLEQSPNKPQTNNTSMRVTGNEKGLMAYQQ